MTPRPRLLPALGPAPVTLPRRCRGGQERPEWRRCPAVRPSSRLSSRQCCWGCLPQEDRAGWWGQRRPRSADAACLPPGFCSSLWAQPPTPRRARRTAPHAPQHRQAQRRRVQGHCRSAGRAGPPAACTVGCMVAGSVGWSCPPQMSWTSLWPALPLSPAALSPGGLALTSTPDRPQLPSPRAPSCPRTEERPSQRAPGSQVRAGPTWGRVGDPGVGEAGDPVVDARHSGVSPARLPRRPRAEGGGQGAGRCLRPAP